MSPWVFKVVGKKEKKVHHLEKNVTDLEHDTLSLPLFQQFKQLLVDANKLLDIGEQAVDLLATEELLLHDFVLENLRRNKHQSSLSQ